MLDSTLEGINAVREGQVIIVVDDEHRENEGDFICAAQFITSEVINFMATHGRGLICTALTESRCQELALEDMVGKNTSSHSTPFTHSVDLIGHGCTTGISASDRAKTVQALVDPHTCPEELGRPGHIFPLKAKNGGVLRRAGHTEAAIDFPRLAGLQPAGVLVEILNEDGSMARLPDLRRVADRFNLKLVSIEDLIEYRLTHETLIQREVTLPFKTLHGELILHAYRQIDTNETHLALVKGSWAPDEVVTVRVHASNLFEDIFGTVMQQEFNVLQRSLEIIAQENKGAILYMNQEGMGTDLLGRLKEHRRKQTQAEMPASKVPMDVRDYGVGAQILRDLNVRKLRLITNHPIKRVGLQGYGLEIDSFVPLHP